MKATTPLVSVLVPTYNGARYLDQALRSVRRQTYRNLEVIIRDDGSHDATADIARSYCDRDHRFSFRADDGRRLGGTGNMIELLGQASGEFVKYLHQDDLLEPACIERLARPMRFDSSLTVSTSSRNRIDGNGEPFVDGHPAYQPLAPRDGKFAGDAVIRQEVTSLTNHIGEPSIALFRNGLVSPADAFSVDGVTYSYLNDLALWTNLLQQGNLYWAVEPLSAFRVHAGQRSAQLHESVTLAGEVVSYIEFGVRHNYLDNTDDFMCCMRFALSNLARLSDTVAGEPEHSRAEYEKGIARAVTQAKALLAASAAAA
jgi:glycosyltransferase involved in cell wall biosynthesis